MSRCLQFLSAAPVTGAYPVCMQLPLSTAIAARLVFLHETGSTNAALAASATAGDEPHFSVLATLNQSDGRGRLGRVWQAPPGTSLAISVYLAPTLPSGAPLPLERYGWFPLIAGAAMTQAVRTSVPDRTVGLKWPNDVQIDGAKVSGLLAELLPGAGVVLGAGLNLTMTAEQLPVPTATSLALNGVEASGDTLVDLALSSYLGRLRELLTLFLEAGADARSSGIHSLVSGLCSTVGQEVRVQMPGASDLLGMATGIDESGRLLVTSAADGGTVAVAAGDVTHLRYE